MKTNQFTQKSLTSKLYLLVMLCFFTGMLVTGCKKDNPALTPGTPEHELPEANLVPDEDETEYTMENYQEALDNVTYDGDRLVFGNLSHFFVTAMALDSLGDSTANVWFQNLGFTNSLYDEYEDAIENMPDAQTEAELTDYFADYANSTKYNANYEVWDVNAMNGIFARLLDANHTAILGGNVFYSDYDFNITVSIADEGLIPQYLALGEEQDDEYAIILKNRAELKTSAPGGCLPLNLVYDMGTIACGSPAQKRARVELQTFKMKNFANIWFSGAIVKVWHDKRGLFGLWFKDYRGSQVGCVVQGKYFNQAKTYGNSNYLHEYGVYRTPGLLPFICWSYIDVCVAPMCFGQTICNMW